MSKSGIIRQYTYFKQCCQGYALVELAEFRDLWALKGRAEWKAADEAVLEGAVGRGAGHALDMLYGAHPRWRALAAARRWRVAPEALTADELDTVMSGMTRACRDWSAQAYEEFIDYLNSDLRLVAPEAPENHPLGGDAPAPIAEKRLKQDMDEFADLYRAAGPAFRARVVARLQCARRS